MLGCAENPAGPKLPIRALEVAEMLGPKPARRQMRPPATAEGQMDAIKDKADIEDKRYKIY